MKRSDINPLPEYFDRYMNQVADVELSQAFDDSIAVLNQLDIHQLEQLDGKIYAPDKWTCKTVIQHITDFERIFSYRALLFARGDKNTRQGVDENLLAENCRADMRSTAEVVAELKAVRLATKALFDSFDEEVLRRAGINWKFEVSVASLGFTLLGHQIHHLNIIRERYLPLLNAEARTK